jgi:tetratricopeptide (TPR) repeat protein
MSRIISALLMVCALGISVSAQRNPTMTSQRDDNDRDNLYTRYAENKKLPSADHQRLAYDAASEYIKRYGADNDPYLPDMRKFVGEYEKGSRLRELLLAYQAKNYKKAFEAGANVLRASQDDFFVLALLAQAGYANAQAGNSDYTIATISCTKKAIELLENLKAASPDPFVSKQAATGFLNFALGWFLRSDDPATASVAFTKAAQSESDYAKDPLTYNLLGVTILKGAYTSRSAEYNEKFGSKPGSPEQQAALQQLMHLGERAVDAYARAVALSTRPEQQEAKNKMMVQLTSLYKSFHNDSDEGLSDLINTVLSKPVPNP